MHQTMMYEQYLKHVLDVCTNIIIILSI